MEGSADLEAVSVDIAEVRMLDGLVRYRFGDNPALMEGWASARDVLGPLRSKVQQQESEAGGGQTRRRCEWRLRCQGRRQGAVV